MAEKLESFSFTEKYGQKYPWDEWLDGSIWKLSRGEDFDGTISSFRSQIYARARHQGIKVRVHQGEDDGVLVVQAYESDDE